MTSTAATRAAEAVRVLIAYCDHTPLDDALAVYAAIDGVVEAARSHRLGLVRAAAQAAGHDPHKAAKAAAARGGKNSRRDAEAAAKRAAAIEANPTLGERVATGHLTTGQLDNIAHASATDPAAANDTGLIDRIAERSVDQGRRVANDWALDKTSAKELERQHKRQRRNRSVHKYWSADRNAMALTLYGDGPSIDLLWRQINTQERIEYRNDGGRDVPIVDHPRTRDQRRFDAAVAIFNGTATPSAGRPAAVITIPWHKLCDDNDACMEQVGYGPIPDTAAIDALARSNLFINLTDIHGQTLWWGRSKRNADHNQFIALVLRDKGCVLCGADWQHCESHHLLPWEARRKGDTNLDNLALVCATCHHRLHDTHLTLFREPSDGQWLTRPAKPDEIAPKRPNKPPPTQRPATSSEPTNHRKPATNPTPAKQRSNAHADRPDQRPTADPPPQQRPAA